jgi:hypothetical protein
MAQTPAAAGVTADEVIEDTGFRMGAAGFNPAPGTGRIR